MRYIISAAVYGCVTGISWALALGNKIRSGFIYGSVIGCIVGFVFYLLTEVPTDFSNIDRKDTFFTVAIFWTFITLACIFIALMIWLLQLIL